MAEHLTDVKDIQARLKDRSGPMEDPDLCANALRLIERLRTALTGVGTCSTCEACRGAALRALGGVEIKPSADAQRWAFFRKHHLSDYQGKRVHQWLMDNLPRADGIDAAIDELIRVSETTGEGAQ